MVTSVNAIQRAIIMIIIRKNANNAINCALRARDRPSLNAFPVLTLPRWCWSLQHALALWDTTSVLIHCNALSAIRDVVNVLGPPIGTVMLALVLFCWWWALVRMCVIAKMDSYLMALSVFDISLHSQYAHNIAKTAPVNAYSVGISTN